MTVAGATVDLWCPISDSAHVLFGHSLPILLLAIAGAFLGQHYVGVTAENPEAA